MGGFRAACAFVANWFFIHPRVIYALHPDIIVLGQRAYDDPRRRASSCWETVSDRSLQSLRAPGRKLVILGPPPSPPKDSSPLVSFYRHGFGRM
jgi:hypothetical protein